MILLTTSMGICSKFLFDLSIGISSSPCIHTSRIAVIRVISFGSKLFEDQLAYLVENTAPNLSFVSGSDWVMRCLLDDTITFRYVNDTLG